MNFPKYRGYIGSRMAFGRSVPQGIQQMVIRDYCQRNSLEFMLSATEYIMDGSTMILDSALREESDGIVFYSIALLPNSATKRAKLYISGKSIKFAAENLPMLNRDLIETTFFVSNYHGTDRFLDVFAYLHKTELPRACY